MTFQKVPPLHYDESKDNQADSKKILRLEIFNCDEKRSSANVFQGMACSSQAVFFFFFATHRRQKSIIQHI